MSGPLRGTVKNLKDPEPGEIWRWNRDGSGCHEIYGPGIVLGLRDGYDYQSDEPFVTFHFGDRGVLNLPLPMVKKCMHPTT